MIRATWYWYITWSGRYSASALDSVFGILGPRFVSFVTPSVIAVWLISIGLFVSTILPLRKNKVINTILLAAGILFLTLNFTPHIQQSLYWGQGMRSVVPPLILGTAYFGIFFALKNIKQLTRNSRILWYLLSFLLAFGIGGFSETYCVVQLAAFGFALFALPIFFGYPFRSFAFSFLFFGLSGAVLSFIAIMIAPGNASRAAYFPPPSNILGILQISSKSFLVYLDNLFSSIESVTGFSGILLLSVLIGFICANKKDVRRDFSVILFGGLLLTFSCFPPAGYAMSDMPPGRTLIIATYTLATLVVFSGYYFGCHLSSEKVTAPRYLYFTFHLLLFISLLISSFIVSRDMYASRHKYIDFAIAWDKTHSTLVLLKNGAENVVVPAVVDEWSGVLRMADNPRFYVNACVSHYYGFDSIVATNDLPPTKPR